jgi:Asp-tRNA(Asn)/Glu-tRNA(Gln) amidotransferase B subunit
MAKQYETVIGLEVHIELATKTKIFCGCSTEFGGAPNTHTCPVCTGMPGSLPVLNKQVVEYAMAIGLATNCKITQVCKFDRKNYFYPDNPQNYQISQLYLPIARDGYVEIESGSGKKKVRIHEMHMEEDAGKLVHDEWDDTSLVDYNRSGVPLVEIVSEPDMRSAEEVIAYLEKLRMIVQYLGASDCKLQEGSMRADVNLSVREVGSDQFGTRTEMKNLNSFKAIAHAIEGERQRQIELIEEGKQVVQETRRWDDNKEHSYAMRSKEDAQDYRYFPEPDLVPIVISDEWIEKIKSQQPELRTEKLERFDGVKYGYRTKDYDGLHNMYKKTRSEGFGPEVKRRIMLGSFVLSSGYYDAYYLKALRTKALIKKEFDRAFRNYDIILGPAAPTTAPELGKSLSDPMKMYLGDIYTISVNLAGLPGMSVPVGKDSKGLPIGMQLIGNVFEEKTLIRAAYTYECATKKMHETPANVGLMSEKEVR